MKKLRKRNFNNSPINIYRYEGQVLIKRHELGEVLEYSHPIKSASKLHSRHKGELNKHAKKIYTKDSSGVKKDIVFYNLDAVNIFCSISYKEKSNDFMEWFKRIVREVEKNE